MKASTTHVMAMFATAAFVSASGAASAQPEPIQETKGVEISHEEAIDLAPWANDMNGRRLRIRKVTIQPGGIVGVHSHDDRPNASYLIQGSLTEYRTGGFRQERGPDTEHTAGKNIVHWQVNEGRVPAILIVVDVYKPAQP